MSELTWGQTPWDNMKKEELLIELWRMHQALSSARSIMKQHELHDSNGPYWTRGVGKWAIDEANSALHIMDSMTDEQREILYKGFFRNAEPLLFDNECTNQWDVCPVCMHWFGRKPDELKMEKCFDCGGTEFRDIKWEDFSDFHDKLIPKSPEENLEPVPDDTGKQ